MSIIDNLLVLLDDGNEYTLEDIQRAFPMYTKQIISATLGRICSKKLICKKNNKFNIYTKTQEIITSNLNQIDSFSQRINLNNPLFILFNIPEKQRIYRDILRNLLLTNGFGRLHNTVWISFKHQKSDINKLIKNLNIPSEILIFDVALDENNLNFVIPNITWDYKTINQYYKQFQLSSKKYLSKKNKSSILARCLVYEFSKIINLDPLIPDKYLDKKYEGYNAFKYYQKIRKYCN